MLVIYGNLVYLVYWLNILTIAVLSRYLLSVFCIISFYVSSFHWCCTYVVQHLMLQYSINHWSIDWIRDIQFWVQKWKTKYMKNWLNLITTEKLFIGVHNLAEHKSDHKCAATKNIVDNIETDHIINNRTWWKHNASAGYAHAPLIRLQRMALYKFVLIDWLISTACRGIKVKKILKLFSQKHETYSKFNI